MKVGILEDTNLRGKKIILEPRKGLKKNEYYVGTNSIGGSPTYSLYCLVCEKPIPTSGCLVCNKK